jgi:mono/diheme cytochrome c family protein
MQGRRAGWLLLAVVGWQAPAGAEEKLPPGDGRKIVETVCATCHGLEIVTSKSYSRERWSKVVEEMVAQGAPLRKAEAAKVIDYLSRNFGEKDHGKELYEEVCSYCHELERVSRQSLTKEEWRGLIKGMVDEGAPVTDEEFGMIVDYLAKHFGPKGLREAAR